jgi:hypothetical protein
MKRHTRRSGKGISKCGSGPPAAAPVQYLRRRRQDRSPFARARAGVGKTPQPKDGADPWERISFPAAIYPVCRGECCLAWQQ